MPQVSWDRPLARAAGRRALVFWLILGTAGCEAAPTPAADPGAPFLLTTRGEPVRASSPPGVEVTLGAKRVLPTGEPSGLDRGPVPRP
jgi:hypothetical protein